MNELCLYAIARFMPFVETEEFANVGVVLFAPAQRYFGFQLLADAPQRITQFFATLQAPVFQRAMHDLREELERLPPLFAQRDATAGMALWQELIKPKSSQIRFSTERIVLTNHPAEQLPQLYGRYVARSPLPAQPAPNPGASPAPPNAITTP
ncbi:DUF3037 domain-containing protein [Vandammella animalimorsus]|uniref:DUF3037 domain-containing protein n=1 Tax=Vandammella animalimorsus TaxID=2029117 RepID=A0A2A2ABT5_9BURK|nr:DUF3037 domain-containing protein [Vandammella animalimorsus]PAT36010.1 hypothetical protein CK620_01905 [Vandammella animalimorsus]